MPLEASVIIPHYNDSARLLRCLDALLPQVAGQDVEVVVVDNASPVPPPQVPGVRLVIEPARGAAAARNRGVAETTAPRLFFLDCDCVPAPGWLATALEVADHADVVGGAITVFDETPQPRSGAEAFETVFAFNNQHYIESKGFSVTANLLTSRSVFDVVGPFRPGLSEDLDWCQRATATGYTLMYHDSLNVAHPSRSDWQALKRKWRRLTDESWALQGTGTGARMSWGLRATAMPLSIIVHMPRLLLSRKLNSAGERARGLLTLVRVRLTRAGWMLAQAMSPGPRP